MSSPKDNRELIEKLNESGDLKTVKRQVDWEYEAGGMVRKTCEENGPALLFENIKDYPEFRMFGSPMATFRRFAVALGLSPDTPARDLVNEYEKRQEKLIKPVMVKNAPCQENVIQGDDVDLFNLPVPLVHDGDGGRYIGTWHINIAKDPDSDWVNWGTYRLQLNSRNIISGLCLPSSDQGRIFYGKYVPQNKPMPIAIAIGADPISSMLGMASIGVGENEVDYAGALLNRPVELTKAVSNDIPVPANAEIILEGELLPNAVAEEGPFGEYTGYRSAPRALRSVYKINTITYRNNPIFAMSCFGVPVDDFAIGMAVIRSADIKKQLLSNSIPVTAVYVPPEGATMLAVVSVKNMYSNVAQQVGQSLFSTKSGGLWMSAVIVVEDDIDVFNMNEVIHAWITKCNPVRGITVLDRAMSSPLHPFLNAQERAWSKGCKVIYDCTWPLDWPEMDTPLKASFENLYPEEVKKRILANWAKDIKG